MAADSSGSNARAVAAALMGAGGGGGTSANCPEGGQAAAMGGANPFGQQGFGKPTIFYASRTHSQLSQVVQIGHGSCVFHPLCIILRSQLSSSTDPSLSPTHKPNHPSIYPLADQLTTYRPLSTMFFSFDHHCYHLHCHHHLLCFKVVRELRSSTAYKNAVNVAVLGSRQQLCVHEHVSTLRYHHHQHRHRQVSCWLVGFLAFLLAMLKQQEADLPLF